ncbi:MAG TPA: DUF5696 domain-containing protein [Candidatus Angelobacter sp.]|nr:DUF5696 domain-containing protein [Candidatus Angelobacter sp.]
MQSKPLRIAVAFLVSTAPLLAQTLPRAEWGAPLVSISHANGKWLIAGQTNKVLIDEKDLGISIDNGSAHWAMVPSGPKDMTVRTSRGEFPLRLADADKIAIEPYDTGFKTGVKITLTGWRHVLAPNALPPPLDLTLYLTVCLEGVNEELVFDVAAKEGSTIVRELNWPTAMDAHDVDYTLLPSGRGVMLPRDWPHEYYPIRRIKNGKVDPSDHTVLQSHVIESWSMSWWGFLKGKSAMMVIVETPDDASYQFSHPAGGPTVIGPRWLNTLGKFGYLRTVRMCFFENGNYVTLAKRYRRYAMDTGLFVSLKEKIARTLILADLIGTPQTRVSILHNQSEDSDRYDKANHYNLVTFDERAQQLRDLKARGIDRTLVFISGWPHLGYDRQHPDPLPPPEAAGGWAGMKRLADTCHELGYPFIFHDQYRDYYVDAPSYDPQFAIHEEDDSLPAKAAFGTRFGDWKEGQIPFMRHWDGGKQSFLNSRFQVGHLKKNYQLFFDHGIHPDGIYIDVIGYVPPDEDYNPEHPTTRSDAMRGQIALLNWSRHNLGFTATEAGSDWVIPYVDSVNQSGSAGKTNSVPLYFLVYHDAVLVSFGAQRTGGDRNLLQGILYGGVPELPVASTDVDEKRLALMKEMAALNKRVGLLEMTDDEFLDKDRQQERTTFADGTTVTVDWTTDSVDINPPLSP